MLDASAMLPPSGGRQLIGRQLHSARGVGAKAVWPLRLLRVLDLLLIPLQTKQAQRRLTAFPDKFPTERIKQLSSQPLRRY